MMFFEQQNAGPLKHPDDLSSLGSAASLAPTSIISSNPFMKAAPRPSSNLPSVPEVRQPEFSFSTGRPAHANTEAPVQRSGLEQRAQEPSLYTTLLSSIAAAVEPAPTAPAAPYEAGRSAQAVGHSVISSHQPATAPPTVLPVSSETEIDRLVREKLVDKHHSRAQVQRQVQSLAERNHLSWHGQAVDSVVSGSWALLEGLQYGGSFLYGKLPPAPEPAVACKRVAKHIPIIVEIGDEDDEQSSARHYGPPRFWQNGKLTSGDDFEDLVFEIAEPFAVHEPIPGRILKEEAEFTPIGSEGLVIKEVEQTHLGVQPEDTVSPLPDDSIGARRRPGRRPGDTASALSMSSAMTSSAAALLGGFAAKATGSAEPPATTQAEDSAPLPQRRSGDAKSCLAPSTAMKSSAASSLGAFISSRQADSDSTAPPSAPMEPQASADSAEEDADLAAAIKASLQESAPPAAPKRSGQAKSVLAQSSIMSSSAAGALGGFLASGAQASRTPATIPETVDEEAQAAPGIDTNSPSETPQQKRVPGKAKSVLAQSTLMSSSAAGALGGLLAQGAASRPPARQETAEAKTGMPESAAGSQRPPADGPPPETAATPKRVPGKAKSVLAQSTLMSSSAAGALGGLLAQGAASRPPARQETAEATAGAAETAEGSELHAAEASPPEAAPAPKRVPGQAKSVLAQSTPMSSSAAGALGGLLAQGGGARPRPQEAAPAARSAEMTQERAAPVLERRPDDTQAASENRGDVSATAKQRSRPKGESKTVISGLNTTSSAGALLGVMAQPKRRA
eukprot:TRINITY_DN4967_c0_g1_i1.p1 TRINITY_DN4967_c0_g1~~TRINITY_DN4967_c0_g1_i1.p1  ORF type:complete len:792 (+),score=161.71 TRINITY_DN4967_c0_g1_i1:86-2461(+)